MVSSYHIGHQVWYSFPWKKTLSDSFTAIFHMAYNETDQQLKCHVGVVYCRGYKCYDENRGACAVLCIVADLCLFLENRVWCMAQQSPVQTSTPRCEMLKYTTWWHVEVHHVVTGWSYERAPSPSKVTFYHIQNRATGKANNLWRPNLFFGLFV